MKKVILFLSVVIAILLMTSCLKDGGNNYSDQGFVYVDYDDRGTVFGKAINPQYRNVRLITNNSMMTMQRGEVKYMAFSWDEDYGATTISIGGQAAQADNVQPIGSAIDIRSTYLFMTPQPEEEDQAAFDDIAMPIFHPDQSFMNDLWIFEYAYTAKKGQTAKVEFFKRNDLNENGEIEIDIQLKLTGTPEGTSDQRVGDAIAVNMNQLRSLSPQGNDTGKKLKIRFKYLKKSGSNVEEVSLPSNQQPAYEWQLSTKES